MIVFLIILAIFCSLLLVVIVLAQNSKGGGLSSQFGGSSASQIVGVKKTTDILEKITWGLAIAVLAISLGVNAMITTSKPETVNQSQQTVNQQEASESQSTEGIIPENQNNDSEPLQEEEK